MPSRPRRWRWRSWCRQHHLPEDWWWSSYNHVFRSSADTCAWVVLPNLGLPYHLLLLQSSAQPASDLLHERAYFSFQALLRHWEHANMQHLLRFPLRFLHGNIRGPIRVLLWLFLRLRNLQSTTWFASLCAFVFRLLWGHPKNLELAYVVPLLPVECAFRRFEDIALVCLHDLVHL